MYRFASTLLLAGSAVAQICSPNTIEENPRTVIQKLPDPFTTPAGQKVRTNSEWECRQNLIREQFEAYELGDYPDKPDAVKGTLIDGNTISVSVTVKDKTVAFNATIRKPESVSLGSPYPAIIALGGASIPIPATVGRILFNNDQWASQIGVSGRGKGLFYDLFGANSTGGSMIAWAWGVGRLIDALEQVYAGKQDGLNVKRLGVTGCSRNGKGAFVVGAFEKRIALTLPQESGTGGAGCWRVAASEEFNFAKNIQTLHQIVQENTWFTSNFQYYGFTTVRLPIDHHMLAGLVAPRGLFVMENDIDWLGPVSTTVCMKAGRLIYKAVGVPNNMGFSLTTGHNHCQLPESDVANLNAYIDHFLLDNKFTLPEVEQSPEKPDMSQWVDWTGPANGPFLA